MAEFKLKKENVRSLKDIAYNAIKEAILSSNYTAGEKLVEAELAEQLGISRGPVREALSQLEHDGLVLSQPYKGTVVAELSDDEYEAVYIPLRRLIEGYACKKANEMFTDDDYKYLLSCTAKMEIACDDKDIEQVSKLDEDFHKYIILKCTSKMLTSLWESLSVHFYARIFFQNRIKRNEPTFEEIPQEHYDLIDAIKSSNSGLIEQTLKAHIR